MIDTNQKNILIARMKIDFKGLNKISKQSLVDWFLVQQGGDTLKYVSITVKDLKDIASSLGMQVINKVNITVSPLVGSIKEASHHEIHSRRCKITISKEELQEAREKYKKTAQIAEMFGVSRTHICYLLDKYGLRKRVS